MTATASQLPIDQLWAHCEYIGSLNPAIVDYTSEELGDWEFGDFLHWAWKAKRWPVGGTAIQFRWGALEQYQSYRLKGHSFYSASVPFVFVGKLFRRNKDGKIGKRPMWDSDLVRELFPTARAAFEFLYAAWQKTTDDERQKLWEGCQ